MGNNSTDRCWQLQKVQAAKAGIDTRGLAASLPEEGTNSLVKSWNEPMEVIISKWSALKKAVAG